MHHPLTILPVTTRHTLRRFIRFPWQVYAGNRAWVPPLVMERMQFFDPKRNPFFARAEAQLFLAQRGREVVGTIAAYMDHHWNTFYNERTGCFGFFEVLPDAEAAATLLHTAADWVRERGMQVLRGPMNFSADNDSGLLLDAYDEPPVLLTAYNPPYYRDYIEQAGFTKHADWYAYLIDRETLGGGAVGNLPPRLLRTLDIARKRSGITLRKARLDRFAEELAYVQRLYNSAWQETAGYVPMSDAESAYLAHSLKPFVDPDLIFMAEDQGAVVGVSVTLPDLNQMLQRMQGHLLPFGWWHMLRRHTYTTTARFFAMGVLPTYRRRGIEAAFYFETFCAAVKKGYQRAELSLVAENNTMMRRSAEAFGARIYKTYRVYTLEVGGA